MATFHRRPEKPEVVDAFQWQANRSLHTVPDWFLWGDTRKCRRPIESDWVVKDSAGNLFIISDSDFVSKFAPS